MTRQADAGAGRVLSLPRLLTEGEVAQALGCSTQTVNASDSAGASATPVSVAAASDIQRTKLPRTSKINGRDHARRRRPTWPDRPDIGSAGGGTARPGVGPGSTLPTRQTCRTSLGTEDLDEAKLALAAWITANAKPEQTQPEDAPLETYLVRYLERHAKYLPSAEPTPYGLVKWSEFFAGALVSEITPQRQREFVDFTPWQGA